MRSMAYRRSVTWRCPGSRSLRKLVYLVVPLYRNIRVKDWRAYMATGMLGYLHCSSSSPASQFTLGAATLAATLALYLAFAFSINNCFDVDCDRLQQRKLAKNPVAAGLLSFKTGLTLSLCMAFAGSLLTLVWFQPAGTPSAIYLALLALAGFYSSPPLRLKSVPFLDLLSHSLFFGGLLYLYGASVGGEPLTNLLPVALSISLYSAVLELRNHLEDFQADADAGIRTAATWLGYERAETALRALLAWHWACLTAVSLLLYPYASAIPMAALTYLFARWRGIGASSSYLRVADLATCAVYAAITLPYTLTAASGVLPL